MGLTANGKFRRGALEMTGPIVGIGAWPLSSRAREMRAQPDRENDSPTGFVLTGK